ncbi:MAG: hypothetical protein LBM68_03200 [Bacteroidales bacterium]|jgi:hypothetical protein|nr:hypothetical protein [Bacteroidales bacterium]
MSILKKALTTALDLSRQNKQSQAEVLLRKIYEAAQSEQGADLPDNEMWLLAKALLVWYQYDNFETEQERLAVLKKVYLSAECTIEVYERKQQAELLEPFYEALLTQILILHNCNEDFEMIVADVYNRCMKESNTTIASRIAPKAVLHILYNTIVKIDDAFENFHNNEWIEKLCNTIETRNPDITPQQLLDAEKIQRTIVRVLRNDTIE